MVADKVQFVGNVITEKITSAKSGKKRASDKDTKVTVNHFFTCAKVRCKDFKVSLWYSATRLQ